MLRYEERLEIGKWYAKKKVLQECDECPLLRPERQNFVPGYGSLKAKVAIVGEAPGKEEVNVGIPFVGDAGQLLEAVVEYVGLKREDLYITNSCICRPPDDRTPTAAEIRHCNKRLEFELSRLEHLKVILVLGAPAIQAVTGKAGSVQSKFGLIEWSDKWGAFLVFSPHPAAILYEPDVFPDLGWAVQQVPPLLKARKGAKARQKPVFAVAEGELDALVMISGLSRQYDFFSCDLETDGLDWQLDPILEIGISPDEKTGYIIPAEIAYKPRVHKALKKFFESKKYTFLWHNGKFDIKFLREQMGIEARVDEDSMMAHYALDERRGTHRLKTLARIFCGADDYDQELRRYVRGTATPMSAAPPYVRYPYLADDTTYTFGVFRALDSALRAEPPSRMGYSTPYETYRKLLVPATNALAEIERRGIAINTKQLEKLNTEMLKELDVIERKAIRQARTKLGAGAPFNVRSPKQIAHVLYDLHGAKGVGGREKQYREWTSRTTNKEALRAIGKTVPLANTLLEYRHLQKMHGTYVEGIRKRLGETKRIHPDFLVHGTRTGRLSCADPNMQNIPRDSALIKSLYAATKGYVFAGADYEQLEVRIAALLSGDKALMEALKGDIHWETTKNIFEEIVAEIDAAGQDKGELEEVLYKHRVYVGSAARERGASLQRQYEKEKWPVEELPGRMKKHLRHVSKCVTFGVLYGRGARSLAQEELACEEHDAQEYIDAYFERYSNLKHLLDEQKRLARVEGWVETLTGRRRRFPFVSDGNLWKIEKQAVNAPIQSLASDMNLIALVRLHDKLRKEGLGYVLFTVHDALYFELRKESVDEGCRLIKAEMESIIKDPLLNFPVGVEIGPDWGRLKKYKPKKAA